MSVISRQPMDYYVFPYLFVNWGLLIDLRQSKTRMYSWRLRGLYSWWWERKEHESWHSLLLWFIIRMCWLKYDNFFCMNMNVINWSFCLWIWICISSIRWYNINMLTLVHDKPVHLHPSSIVYNYMMLLDTGTICSIALRFPFVTLI